MSSCHCFSDVQPITQNFRLGSVTADPHPVPKCPRKYFPALMGGAPYVRLRADNCRYVAVYMRDHEYITSGRTPPFSHPGAITAGRARGPDTTSGRGNDYSIRVESSISMKPDCKCSMNRTGETRNYPTMWVYGGGPPDKPVIWYQYADTRSGDVPEEFLYPKAENPPDGAMYLVTDGYEGYNALSESPGILGHGACWAHVRRRFVEATHGRKNTAPAHQMVALISKLYQVERAVRNKSAQEREAIRRKKATPILDKIKTWLDEKVTKVLPKSPLGTAISVYPLYHWYASIL